MADIHYPIPSHRQEALGHLRGRVGQFPIAEKACTEIVSLPMYPELTSAMIDEVVASVRDFCRA
jgi:dTDP-4-amino-4,6-dideoxygalactose transaminase